MTAKREFNPIESFKQAFNQATGMSVEDFAEAEKRQKKVTANSRNNIRFNNYPSDPSATDKMPNFAANLGQTYADALADITDFYKNEFKVIPRATIDGDLYKFDDDEVAGLTYTIPRRDGQYDVSLYNITDDDVDYALEDAKESEEIGWWPKNSSSSVAGVPVHELGHVLTAQLFPDEKNVSKLVNDSLKDIGIKYGSQNFFEDARRAAEEISGYASIPTNAGMSSIDNLNGHEVISEALTDYYYNRDNASNLSKAIVKRLKNKGATYGLEQAGGIAKPNESFLSNLRRYNVLQ